MPHAHLLFNSKRDVSDIERKSSIGRESLVVLDDLHLEGRRRPHHRRGRRRLYRRHRCCLRRHVGGVHD